VPLALHEMHGADNPDFYDICSPCWETDSHDQTDRKQNTQYKSRLFHDIPPLSQVFGFGYKYTRK
jgi:hypothetical protein